MEMKSTLLILVVAALTMSAHARRREQRQRGAGRQRGQYSPERTQARFDGRQGVANQENPETRPGFGRGEGDRRMSPDGEMGGRRFDGSRFGGPRQGNGERADGGMTRPGGFKLGNGKPFFGQGGRRDPDLTESDMVPQPSGDGRRPWGPDEQDGPGRFHPHPHHHRHHHHHHRGHHNESEESEEQEGSNSTSFQPFRRGPFGRRHFGRRNGTDDESFEEVADRWNRTDAHRGPFDHESRRNRSHGDHDHHHRHHGRHNDTDTDRPGRGFMNGRPPFRRPEGRGPHGNRDKRPFGGRGREEVEEKRAHVPDHTTIAPADPEMGDFELNDNDNENVNGEIWP